MQWYYEKDGGQAGPVEDGELGTLVRAGVIRGDTLVWRDGLRDWEPAHRHVRGLAPGVQAGAGMGRNYAERVGMGEALRRFFLNYVNLRGRSNRGEYWWAVLALLLISFALGLIEGLAGWGGPNSGPLTGLFNLVTLLPGISLAVRRLHDTDRRGWWILAPVVPMLLVPVLVPWRRIVELSTADPAVIEQVLGNVAIPILLSFLASLIMMVVLLVWYCQRPTPGPNRFG